MQEKCRSYPSTLLNANKILGQKCPHSTYKPKHRKQRQQAQQHNSLSNRNLFPIELEIKQNRQDDGDERAERSAEECTNWVKRREQDGNAKQDEDNDHTN